METDEKKKERKADRRNIIAWIDEGSYRHHWYEKLGCIHTDLHKDNYIYTTQDKLVICDLGGIIKIDYPIEWNKLTLELVPLLSSLDDFELSAFRFGFIQNGGPIGRKIFDILRTNYNLNAFRNIEKIDYEIPIEEELSSSTTDEIQRQQKEWISLKSKFNHGKFDPDLTDLDLGNLDAWRKHYKSLNLEPKDEMKVFEFQYYYHLAAAFYHRNLTCWLEALENLAVVFNRYGKNIEAAGLMLLCNKVCEVNNIPKLNPARKEITKNLKAALSYISKNQKSKIEELLELPEMQYIFHFLWALDDIAFYART